MQNFICTLKRGPEKWQIVTYYQMERLSTFSLFSPSYILDDLEFNF